MNANFLNKYTRSLYTNINKKIYIIAFIFIVIVLLWTIIQNIFGKNNGNTSQNSKNTSIYKPAETVISGKDITESVYKEDEALINKFVDYCNDGNTEEAYNLLSNDCKEIIFNNRQDDFKEYYYNEIFSSKREYNLQSWISKSDYHTYRVRMIDDIMSTGNYSNSNNYQDYMTVFKDGDNQYLNIKGFISKKDINKNEENDEIKLSVISEITYIDYIEYEFNIKNKTGKKVLMDSLKDSSKTMYIELTGDKKRSSTSEGLSRNELIIDSYSNRNIKIKYNKTASNTDNVTKKISFMNIIKDYDSYISTHDYNDMGNITINL